MPLDDTQASDLPPGLTLSGQTVPAASEALPPGLTLVPHAEELPPGLTLSGQSVPATPQYTIEKPFVPPKGHTQQQADAFFGLPPGTPVQTPEGLRLVPKPKAEEAAVDPITNEKVTYSTYDKPPEPPGAVATGLHTAERAAFPTTAGVVGFGPGFAAGMGAGAFTGPLAPVASPVLGVLGGAITGYLSSRAAQAAQDVLATHIPDSIKEIAGQDEATRQAEIKAHPWITEYLPEALNLAFFRPGAVANVARAAAGPVERFVVNQIAGRAPTSALMGAQTAGIEAAEGQPLDTSEIAKSALIGGVLNHPTQLSRRALAIGEAPVRAIMPVPENAAPGTPPTGATPVGGTPGTPPSGAPPVGSRILMPMPDADGQMTDTPMTVSRVTPQGDFVLVAPDGIEYPHTPEDIARLGKPVSEVPNAPEAAPPAAEGAPGEAVPQGTGTPTQRTTVDVNGQRVADTVPPEPISRPRTQADLDRESAEQRSAEARAALVGQAPPTADPIGQALAADNAELARPQVPRGTETAALTPENIAQVPDGAFNGDLERGLTRIFYSDQYNGQSVPLTNSGFRPDEITALQRAGLASPDGRMSQAQFNEWMEERSRRLNRGQPPKAAPEVESTMRPPREETREDIIQKLEASQSPVDRETAARLRAEDEARQQPPIAPTAQPFVEHQIQTGTPTPHVPVPAERGAPFERPVVSPEIRQDNATEIRQPAELPPVEVPATEPAETRPGLTESDDAKLARLAALEAENAAPEQGGFVRRLEAEQAAEPVESVPTTEGQAEQAAPVVPTTEGQKPVFEYGARFRPIGYATVPEGRIGTRPDPAYPSHGVVQYDRPLTEHEISAFELEPIAPKPETAEEAFNRMVAEHHARNETADAIGREEGPVVLVHERPPYPSLGAIIHPSTDEPGQWQYTTFSDDGFLGHTTRATKAEAVRLAMQEGYRDINRDFLRQVASTEKFRRGNEIADEARRQRSAEASVPPPTPERPANAPTITDEIHTKTRKPIFAVRFPEKPDIADLGGNARRMGGQWSSYRGQGMTPGWMFKTREAADRFAVWATEKLAPEAETSTLGPYANDLIPEYRKALEDYAAAGHTVWVQRSSGALRVRLDGGAPQTPVGAMADIRVAGQPATIGANRPEPSPALRPGEVAPGVPAELAKRVEDEYADRVIPSAVTIRQRFNLGPDMARAVTEYVRAQREGAAKGIGVALEDAVQRPRAPVDDWADEIVRAYHEQGANPAIETYKQIVADKKLTNAANAVLTDRLRSMLTPEEIADVQRAQSRQPAEQPRPLPVWKEIGKNADGQTLYEDARGVRSRLSPSGIRTTEPVGLRPTRGGMEFSTDRTAHPEYEVAAPEAEPTPTRATRTEQEIGRDVVQAREDTNDDPTDAQIASGTYKKGRVDFHGVPFVMETPSGALRKGPTGPDGQPVWTAEMPLDVDYGYIARTRGMDDEGIYHKPEGVDAYLGPQLASQRAWVIDQVHAESGAPDEHKIMLAFNDWPRARLAYLESFSDGRGEERIGNVTPMSLDELKMWLKNGDTKNPIGQQALPLSEPARAPAEHPPHEGLPHVRLASAIEGEIASGRRMTAASLQQMAETAFGGKMAAGKFTRADIYDALELGVNRYVRANRELFNPAGDIYQARRAVDLLEKIKNDLPTQTVRAGEKEAMQQFSTPPDYAFAAAWAAKIEPGRDRVLEPSAGTGSIVAPVMNAQPREVIVNELSTNRAPLVESLAPDRAFRENAEQLHNILPKDVRPTVVVMNPPFSQTAGRMGNKMVAGTGARHVEQALARLEPGGRLVAIVGRGMRAYTGAQPSGVRFGEGTGAAFRDWWARIGREYDVRANVGVPGEVYGKYGTTFGTQLLVIDKNPPSGRSPVIADATSIPDLIQKLEGVRDDRVPIEGTGSAEQLAAQPGGQAPAAGSENGTRPDVSVSRPTPGVGVRAGVRDTGAGSELPGRPGTGGEPTIQPRPEPGPSDAVAAQQPERGGPGGTERHPETGIGERSELAGSGAEPDAMVLRPEGGDRSVLPTGTEGGITEHGPVPEIVRVQEAAADPETAGPITENVYEAYKPQRITIKGAVEHPTALVQSAAMASVMPPEVSYVPKIPKALVTGGKLSDAQLEAVTYAGHAHSQMLPAPEGETQFRRGYFIGDGTGVGKGAQVAGIILDNMAQGRKRALWFSEKRPLINDAKRDWKWLGRDPKEVYDIAKMTKPGSDIKIGQGIGFMTYDTLKGYERQGKDEAGATIKGQTRVDQIINWLGKDFDGVIAFDESHNLANSIATKGTRGIKDAAAKALAGIELQQKLPNARVVYVSATGATEVMNLAYAERLGLWGRGTAFPNKNDFISKISSGGVAAMELVARDMKAMGHYISRNLSYDGVEYDRVEHTLTPDQHAIYDGLAEGWQTVLQNIEEALVKTGVPDHDTGETKADSRQRADALSAFWSGHQRFFNQIITSMQMPTVIRNIERDLAEGRQAVLQLVNTNEASQERSIARARAEKEGDLEDLDMTPRDQLMQMIDKSFPTAQREQYLDENGNERTRTVVDSAGSIVHNPEALAMKDALLNKLGSIRVPDGPLEMLINHFGTDEVAEITGRKQRVVRKADENGQMHNVVEPRPGSANITEADAFQNAKKRILVFSGAGMTGRSYHADLSSPSADARRSHYLLQAGWRADAAIQGFGRTHRTNQASAPIFHLVTTDLEGQKRFISSIARRLAQLGALTKGERRAGESGMFSARDNLESNEAKAALGQLWRDVQRNEIPTINGPDFEKQTGLKLKDGNGNSTDSPPITQFLNRLLSLKFDMQNHVFGEFADRLNTAVDRAAAAGTLDVGTETLRADRITKEDDRIVHTDAQSGAQTRYVRLKVENKSYPRSFEDVTRRYQPAAGEQPPFFVTSKRSGKTLLVSPSRDVTDATTGAIVSQYRLVDPLRYDFTERSRIDGRDADRYWERIENPTEAKRRWDEQVSKIPEYTEHDAHLITGAILPIWDRLQGYPQVYRLQTDAGEKMLGRTVADAQIDHVLKALGAEETGRQYTPAQVSEQIMGGGRATLANGWTLRRSMVAGEPRIELTGPNYTHDAELSGAGVFTERIGYTTRYFIPTGDGSVRALEGVLERRPVVEMERAARRNLEEQRPGVSPNTGASPDPARSMTDDLLRVRRENYPEGAAGSHQATRDFVRTLGDATGHEYFGGVDSRDGMIVDAGTSNHPSQISFNDETLRRLWNPNGSPVDLHHNHPSNYPLSTPDIGMLAAPNLRTVIAHGADGSMYSARLTPDAQEWVSGIRPAEAQTALYTLSHRAIDIVDNALNGMVESGRISRDQADNWVREGANQALAAAGVIDYISPHEIPTMLHPWIARAARALSTPGEGRLEKTSVPWKADPEAIVDRIYRSARAVSPEEGMARLSQPDEGIAAGRPAGPGSDEGGGRGAEPPAQPGGLAEEGADRLEDYRKFAGERTDAHQTARDYILDRGRATGQEHLVAIDPAGRTDFVLTSAQEDAVAFSPALEAVLATPGAGIVLQHYHPADGALSSVDISALARPGLHTVVAHGSSGDSFSATLSDGARAGLLNRSPIAAEAALLGLYNHAGGIIGERIKRLVASGALTIEQGERIYADMVNRSLAAAGVIDYQGSRELALQPALAKSAIRQAAESVSRVARTLVPIEPVGDFDARINRSTDAVQFDRTVANFPRQSEAELAAGRPDRPSADAAGREGIGQPTEGDESVVDGRPEEPTEGSGGLAEEGPRDYTDEATTEAVDAALRAAGPRGYGAGVDNALGAAPNSPGFKQHDFNIINKWFTTAWVKAGLDTLWGNKFRPELEKKRLATTLFNSYKDMPSWRGITPEDSRELFAVAELATLDGREIPRDGRAIIIENRDHPLAALSKVGDVPSLRRPEQIQRFIDLRNTMDQAFKDQVAGHAERIGWTGEPTAEAIYKAASEAGDESREGRQLKRMARMLAAVEMQYRTSYLPLSRTGEYFLRVTPKAGTPDKPGILGWTGDGYAPTTMFKTMDPLTWMERVTGGMREGTPKLVDAAIADLRKQFPESEFDVQHGYLFRDADAIKDLRIPAIEKLLMLSGNDAQGLLRDNYTRMGLAPEEARAKAKDDYDKITDGILDEIWEARVPGFKKQRQGIPGYCVSPETRILTAEMNYVPAKSLKVGDELVGFDEHSPSRGRRRSLKVAVVEEIETIVKPCWRLEMASGRTVVVSADHHFLGYKSGFGKGNHIWRKMDSIKVGSVLKTFPIESRRNDFEAGWFSGFLDGEGHISIKMRLKRNSMLEMGWSQLEGPVLDRAIAAIEREGINFCWSNPPCRKKVPAIAIGRPWQVIRTLQIFSPMRLMAKRAWVGAPIPTSSEGDHVISNTFVGEMPVLAIRTSTKTFIAEGICSHNSSDFNLSVGRYLSMLANSTARLKYGREIEAADEALLHHPDPRTRDYARDWDRANTDREDGQLYGPLMKMRQAAFYSLLGANVATSIKILLHAPLRGMPILGTGLGPLGRAQAAGEYLKVLTSLGGALRAGKNGIELDYATPSFDRTLSPDERAMFKRAVGDGTIHEQTADEMRAMGDQGEQALTDNQRFFRRMLDIWSSNVSAADRMVRGAAMLAGYRMANRVGMEAIDRVWNRNENWLKGEHTPEAFGRFMVDQTVGIWGPLNRLPIARSLIGGTMMQFKIYETGYLSNMHAMMTRMGPEGKATAALMLGGLGMMGGVVALPFFQDVEKATAAVWGMITGLTPNLEDDLRQIFDRVTDGAGETLLHGPRLGGVDWSSLSFGDVLSRNAQSPLGLLGAAPSTFLEGPHRAYQRWDSGQGLLAASVEAAPNAVKHMLQALYPEVTEYPASGTRRIQDASKISDADRFKTALGLKPEAGALNYEKFQRNTQEIAAYHHALKLAENRLANLSARGESTTDAMTAAQKVITDGMKAGVFNPNEAKQFASDMKRAAIQRAHPEIGNKTMQRMDSARQAAQP